MIILNLTSFNLLACLLLHRVLVLCYEISDVNSKSQLNLGQIWILHYYDVIHVDFVLQLFEIFMISATSFSSLCIKSGGSSIIVSKRQKKGNICLLLKPFCQAETCRCETTIHLMQGFHLKQVVFNSTKWVDFQTLIEGEWIIISFQISLTQEDSTKFSHQIPHSIDLKWNVV